MVPAPGTPWRPRGHVLADAGPDAPVVAVSTVPRGRRERSEAAGEIARALRSPRSFARHRRASSKRLRSSTAHVVHARGAQELRARTLPPDRSRRASRRAASCVGSGTDVTIARWTMIVREVLDGRGQVAKLTVMAKGPPATTPRSATGGSP